MANDTLRKSMTSIMKELDYCDYLTDTKGWIKVDYPHGYESNKQAVDIRLWVEENLGKHHKMGRTYFFEREQDASMFLLKYT